MRALRPVARAGAARALGYPVDAVIARYTRPDMGAVWTDERRLAGWLEVELAALEAWAELGVVPAEAVQAIRAGARVDVARANELERRTNHDVIAFTETIAEQVGEQRALVPLRAHVVGRRRHRARAPAPRRRPPAAGGRRARARRGAGAGRGAPDDAVHGPHPRRAREPMTFGLKLLGWAEELDRGHERLAAALEGLRVGKLSGAVGAYGNVDPRVEELALARLDLAVEPVATQVVPRDRHAALLQAMALLGSSLDRIATEIRHLQRTEVREARSRSRRPEGLVGDAAQAQPDHLRADLRPGARAPRQRQVGLEDVALWHERDISHSSAERVVLPDSTILLDYLLDRAAWVIEGLVVDEARMLENLRASHGLTFSGPRAARARRGRAVARGGVRHRAAQCDAGLGDGRGAARPRRRRPRGRRAGRGGPRRRVRPGARARPRRRPVPPPEALIG